MAIDGALTARLGDGGYQLLGVGFFVAMATCLYVLATRKQPH